ncbi:MAG: 4Fe-4S binding protein [Oscillibacter sp.]|nr:4Fe-4S binding protein [Oscillibacter sp.]
MTLQGLKEKLMRSVLKDPENTIRAAYALRPELAGTPYYEAPMLGCAAADDPLFAQFKADPNIYGSALRLPEEWLPDAKCVISVFLPFAEEVRRSNTPDLEEPSDQWLHGRIEGQAFLEEICRRIAGWLEAEGYQAVIPAIHEDFCIRRDPARKELGQPVFASNWSERHAAFAAGLGTFGLSKHIITEKGVCGRFGSVITDAPLEVTPRPYTEPYEYCTFCGACIRRCPVNAIFPEGKDVELCSDYVDDTCRRHAPRFGCGKCQLAVPCTTRIPARLRRKTSDD